MIAGSIEGSRRRAGRDGRSGQAQRKTRQELRQEGHHQVRRQGWNEPGGGRACTRTVEIVVAGDTSGIVIGDTSSQLFARLTEKGKLDKSFSGDGIFTRKIKGSSTRVEDVAIEKSGRIVGAVGSFDSDSPDSTYGISAVKENGKKDKKFGKKGLALRDFGDDTQLQNIAVQKAGGIVVGGAVRAARSTISWSLASPRRASSTSRFGFKGATVTDFAGERRPDPKPRDRQGRRDRRRRHRRRRLRLRPLPGERRDRRLTGSARLRRCADA